MRKEISERDRIDHIKGDGPFEAVKIKVKKYIWIKGKKMRKGTENKWLT